MLRLFEPGLCEIWNKLLISELRPSFLVVGSPMLPLTVPLNFVSIVTVRQPIDKPVIG